MPLLGPAPHADVLQLLISVTVLLVAARGLAEVAGRLGQPPVVGEILAGVMLGPSLLSGAFPAVAEVVLPDTAAAGYLLELVGLLGAMFLLIVTGMETDIPLIRRHARTALGIAAGGLVLPFAGGLALAAAIPDDLLGDPSRRGVFALFLATALSVSAIPVVAKVLIDLGLIRKTFGQTVLAAGMVDDTVAWVMLSIILGLVGEGATGPVAGALAAARILVFLILAATLGRRLVNAALAVVQERLKSPDRVLTLVVATAFAFGAAAQAIGIEAVLGAFVAGILFGQSPRLPPEVVGRLQSMALAVFSPIFFGLAGLKVEVNRLLEPRLAALTVLVLVVAIAGKVIGAYLGGRMVGVGHWQAFAYGWALDARGAVEIIVASIGLEAGILSREIYSMVVLMAVTTSVITPPLVRAFVRRVPVDHDDERRLERQFAQDQGLGPTRRILIPIRPRSEAAPVHRVEADVVSRLAESPIITLFSVVERDQRRVAEELLAELVPLFGTRPITRVVVSDDPVTPILEAAAHQDLVVLGAPEGSGGPEVLFNQVVDDIARLAPCPTLIITGRQAGAGHWPPRRVLVPTNGGHSARNAAQLGFLLAPPEAEVIVLHVVERTGYARVGASSTTIDRAISRADDLIADMTRLGAVYERRVRGIVRTAASVEETILLAAEEEQIDLVILGISLTPGASRLHIGSRMERVLQRAPCQVFILNSI